MLVSMIIGRGANNIAANVTQARALIVDRRTRSEEACRGRFYDFVRDVFSVKVTLFSLRILRRVNSI